MMFSFLGIVAKSVLNGTPIDTNTVAYDVAITVSTRDCAALAGRYDTTARCKRPALASIRTKNSERRLFSPFTRGGSIHDGENRT